MVGVANHLRVPDLAAYLAGCEMPVRLAKFD